MKKFIAIALIGLYSLIVLPAQAQNTTPRVGSTGSSTGGQLKFTHLNKAYASTIALKADAYQTVVNVAKLTGALTITCDTLFGHNGDMMKIVFTCDTLTAGRVVTFSTGFATSGTLTVDASQSAGISFVFITPRNRWVAVGREKE